MRSCLLIVKPWVQDRDRYWTRSCLHAPTEMELRGMGLAKDGPWIAQAVESIHGDFAIVFIESYRAGGGSHCETRSHNTVEEAKRAIDETLTRLGYLLLEDMRHLPLL